MPDSAAAALPPVEGPEPRRTGPASREAASGLLAGAREPLPARPRHATRALLRAHLAAAVGTRHRTGRCAVCGRLRRGARGGGERGPFGTAASISAAGSRRTRRTACDGCHRKSFRRGAL
ncbi:DUF6274 family protein [Streptomyces sp. NPDC058374]|uniref:DUF6274 family protein n=1 Tax=unclassified Streptomyces TaxID=2593676 RepID=UPI0036672D5C